MNTRVCLAADTLSYPEGGGHFWVYLNWALGLRAAGCQVLWLEVVAPETDSADLPKFSSCLKQRLDRYGLGGSMVLSGHEGQALDPVLTGGCAGLEAASASDLLLSFRYDLKDEIVRRFRRSALVDIDPGLLQLWMSEGQIAIARHDVYFTTGETVGQPGSLIPDVGLQWEYTQPCVALDFWPAAPPGPDAAFTTISHWSGDEWVEHGGEVYINDKRAGFLPFLDLPQHAPQPLELALCLAPDEDEDRAMLREHGWRLVDAYEVAAGPWDYQRYIQHSFGEFSAVKPSCVRLQNAWVSDRTLCYLASGKPAVVQRTGASRFLPDAEGLFRFETLEEAARALEVVMSDYDRHSRNARALVAEFFDARYVASRVLERAVP
jgi:hypothetical protein